MIKEEEKTELLQVKYDDLFHQLFNENEIQTLEWVVMQILGCKPDDVKGKVVVKNIRKAKVNNREKTKYVDLIISYKEETIIIELNFNFKGNYTRNLMYALNELLGSYDKDDLTYYKKIARVILVNLNWFYEGNDFGLPKKQEFILPYPNYKKPGYILKIININLDRYNKLCYNKIRDGDKFYKLLTLKNKDDLDSLASEENMLKSYSNKIINLSKNDEYREKVMNERIEANLLRQEGYFEGIEEGIEQGIEQGIQEKQEEVVINMINNNLSLEMIANCTNLTISEVEKIINSNKE